MKLCTLAATTILRFEGNSWHNLFYVVFYVAVAIFKFCCDANLLFST